MLARMLLVLWVVVMGAAFSVAQTTRPAVTSIDPAKLKVLLPETLLGHERRQVNSQQVSLGDTAMSIVDTNYDKTDDTSDAAPSLELTYADYGSNSPMGDAAAAWANMNFSRETDGEYEKTTKVQGYPALERYDRETKYGTMTIFVASRYIVTLNVANVTPEKMKEAADALPLKKLAELK